MYKNPWFTLIVGLILGIAVGYVLAERQAIPRAGQAPGPGGGQAAMPAGHPPVPADGAAIAQRERLQEQARELERLLAQSPEDHRLMVALGNLYYDASEWAEARSWYERALQQEDGDPDVLTDLAVVYRNLAQPEQALASLDRAMELAPEHWQAAYNKVVVLHFDLHRHDEAEAALARLKELAADNPEIPDLSRLEQEVTGS
jgi:tetratricopeptide (TPR) repeat protein